MDLSINKNGYVEINAQIATLLRYQIINGELEQDTRLPSVREMAELLNVNRHTVTRAYKELEKEGLLVTKQSLGTFVNKIEEIPKKQDLEALVNTIKEAMEASKAMGFTGKEFLAMADFILQKEANGNRVKGLFVECNEIVLRHYVRDLNEKLDLNIEGCLLDDLNREETLAHINDFDLIMTTVAHFPELKNTLKNYNNLYTINVGPLIQVLNKIINLPENTKIGISCINMMGTLALKQALIDLGANQNFIWQESAENLDKVSEMANNVDVLIVSKYALEENADFFNELPNEIIEYSNVLQGSSIRMLEEVISQIKKSKQEEQTSGH